ncbi:unnamed protein product [Scytosiphon promiscuus]
MSSSGTSASKRPERFHGAFTGGWSAGFYNSVGTAEGWTPSTFSSSRDKRAAPREQRPEDFMDDEDGLLTEELQAKPAFDTLGSTADEVARQHAQKEAAGATIPGPAPSELILPVGDPMGKKLLKTMGWREGQGVGNRVRRKRRRPARRGGDDSPDEDLPEMARAGLGRKAQALLDKEGLTFAPANVDMRMHSAIAKTNLYGVGHEPFKDAPEFGASNRAGAGVGMTRRRGVYSTEDLVQQLDDGGDARGTTARLSRNAAALERGSHGFVLDDEEDDVYELGFGKEAYDGELETDGGNKTAHDRLAGRAKAWALSGTADEDEPVMVSRRYARCPSDGRLPPTGFVVAQRPDVQQNYWAPPIPPANFRATYEFEDDTVNPLRIAAIRRQDSVGLDAFGRARLLGEISSKFSANVSPDTSASLEQDKGLLAEDSSALSFLSPAARKKLLEAASGERGPSRFPSPTSTTATTPLARAGAAASKQTPGAARARRQENPTQQPGSLSFSLATKFTPETPAGSKVDAAPVQKGNGVDPASRPAGLTLRTPTTNGSSKNPRAAPGRGEESAEAKVRNPVRRTIDWIPAPLLCKRLNVPVPKASSTMDWATKGRLQAGLVATTAPKQDVVESLRKFVPDSSTSSRSQIPLLKGMEQQHPLAKSSPSESAGVTPAVVADGALKERPPIDLFKSIFESESDSDSEEEAESGGEATAKAAVGEANSEIQAEERAPLGSFGKAKSQRGYGTDSSEESAGREELIAEHRIGDHLSKSLDEEGKTNSGRGHHRGDTAKSSGEVGRGTRRSESGTRKRSSRKHGNAHKNNKKHKKHKLDKESKSEKKHRKHGEKKKKKTQR